MLKKSFLTVAIAIAATSAAPAAALAKGGGGGGGGGTGGGGGGGGTPAPVLPAPAIAPGTFDGIGPGPVYVHESFGHAQTTRLAQNGAIVDVVDKPDINGIRAEYPNNETETWFDPTSSGAPSWKLAASSDDPFEPSSPLQDTPEGELNGSLALVGAEPGAVDTRPDALLPFAAPTDGASTVSGDVVTFVGKTALGFSNSNATTENFETAGQAWLELDATGLSPLGGNTGVVRWTFHTDGLNGTTLSGTVSVPASSIDRAAVSYDPVNHVAAATVNGAVVASVPYTASPIRYVGVEGSLAGNVDNFTVRAGTVTDAPPPSVAAP